MVEAVVQFIIDVFIAIATFFVELFNAIVEIGMNIVEAIVEAVMWFIQALLKAIILALAYLLLAEALIMIIIVFTYMIAMFSALEGMTVVFEPMYIKCQKNSEVLELWDLSIILGIVIGNGLRIHYW